MTYRREAWVSPFDNSVRVTMDSDVLVEPKFDLVPQTAPVYPVRPFGGELILEFKYTARYPDWLRSLVRSFDLTRTGVPKYSARVKSYGVPRFMERPASSLQWRGECAAPA